MTTGKRLLQNVHSASWARHRYRGENVQRDWQSDRMKGVSRALKKQLRSYLKSETKQQVEASI